MKETNIKILKWFINNYKDLYLQMKSTKHSDNDINPYHIECDVWTHTMLVLSKLPDDCNSVVFTAALLHDIGKCSNFIKSYRTINNTIRKSFRNHASMSFYLSIDIVNKLLKSDIIKDENENELNYFKGDILFLIATHSNRNIEIFDNTDICNYYQMLKDADKEGRFTEIPIVDNDNIVYKLNESKILFDDKVCYMIIGISCSGKSTFIENNIDIKRISRDDIMTNLQDCFKNMTYNEIWKYCEENNLHLKVDKIYSSKLNELVNGTENFIVDRTNLVKKRRKSFIKMAKQKGFKVVCVVMSQFGYDEILENNTNRRGKDLPKSVINNMIKIFTYPTYEEGFDLIIQSHVV